jgi:hypothetical protein
VVTLLCQETPGLHLGPGVPGSKNVIDFINGYATIDENDPLFGEKMSWVNSFGCPAIRLLDEGEVPAGDPSAVPCPVCGKTFASDRQVNGHILGAHRQKA